MDNKTNKPTYEGLTMNQLAERNAEHVTTIARLESQVKQLAAESTRLKSAAEFATAPDMWIEQADGMLDYRYHEWYVDALKTAMKTPTTDAYLSQLCNEARAEGVEMFAKHCDDSIGFVEPEDDGLYTLMEEQARMFARQLREGKAGEVCSE